MPIVRSKRPETSFIIVSKTISDDDSISWSARGMLIHLLGKPDNWRVSLSYLVTQTKNAAKKSGREAVSAILSELIDSGYIVRSEYQRHDESGYLCGYDYTVFDSPCAGLPTKVEPCKVNPTLISNDLEQEMNASTAATPRESTHAEQADASVGKPTLNQPAADTRSDVIMCAEWKPSSAFATHLKMAMIDPAKLTEFTLTKFRMHNLGKVRKQNEWEVALLNWLKGESETTTPTATVPRRKASRHNNLDQQEHVTGSF